MATPNYTIALVASPIGGAAGLSPGDGLVYDAASSSYVLATAANRGTKRSSGLAIGSAAVNGAVLMQTCGDIPPSVSGLGNGAAGPVRMSSAGRLERVTSWSAADDVCGWAEADGTVHAFFGGALTGAVIVGGSDGANIVLANPSTWGPSGATVRSEIDTDSYTSNGTARAVGSIPLDEGTSHDVLCTIAARRDDGSTFRVDLFATYKRVGAGAPVLVGAAATETNKRNDAGAAYSAALALNGNTLEAQLTATNTHVLKTSVIWQRQDRT